MSEIWTKIVGRMVIIRALEVGRVRGILQDETCELITMLACISAADKKTPPAITLSLEDGDPSAVARRLFLEQ